MKWKVKLKGDELPKQPIKLNFTSGQGPGANPDQGMEKPAIHVPRKNRRLSGSGS